MALARCVALSAACGVLAAGCVDLWPPPVTGPLENGRMPDGALTVITAECLVRNEIAPNLRAMLAAAHSDGVGLAPERSSFLPEGVTGPPRIESCYRTYEGQVWWRHYYCSIGRCGLAARPGASKHGWGRAVDLQDHLGQLTFESPGYAWLATHAHEFGFFQPPSVRPGGPNEEAWHWEAAE